MTMLPLFPPHLKRIEARLPALLVLRRFHIAVLAATVLGSIGIRASYPDAGAISDGWWLFIVLALSAGATIWFRRYAVQRTFSAANPSSSPLQIGGAFRATYFVLLGLAATAISWGWVAAVINEAWVHAYIGGVIGLVLLITVVAPGRRTIALFNERLHEAGVGVDLTRALMEQPMDTSHGS
ncbi:MAG: hypothetical protein WD096_06015 [Actinomycetota bacterium]